MKIFTSLSYVFVLLVCAIGHVQAQEVQKVSVTEEERSLHSQWNGKQVAFLGDSMTDKRRIGTAFIYWEYLCELLDIKPPYVYGISGHQWTGIYNQATQLYKEHGNDLDAILIFAGTNDYNSNLPIGEFYTESLQKTSHNGKSVPRKMRAPIINNETFCGRINKTMAYLKQKFPEQQIILMTPIHRGYAKFAETNEQPDERFSNGAGHYIDDYVHALKQAGEYWSVPVIDLFSLSGLYPSQEEQAIYFHKSDTDRLHPNAWGNYRLAKTIQYQLLALPATFRSIGSK